MIRFLILSGYFELMMYLMATGKLNQYINVHYSYLAILSMILSLMLSIVQLINWVKSNSKSDKESFKAKYKKAFSYLLLATPLLICLFIPYKSLDASVVDSKGFTFPLDKESGTSDDGTSIQYLQPNTSSYFTKSDYDELMKKTLAKYKDSDEIKIDEKNYMEAMELIYNFPSEFIGKKVSFTGFIYNNSLDGQKYQFLFRFGIIHCIADSGVFGLMLDEKEEYENNTWVHVEGTIESKYFAPYKRNLPTVLVNKSEKVNKPSNPYVYRTF
ncbi:TIGR03943 family putative permease subunit [Floricoccus penangensis]|uniref:TIGR03943 family putative permease subunit n=1 Tax=Floricoccus penangensis TaxID=1859475 RepID=UPI00203EE26A|nr:TIGR03943 family protein [Floricoccus penangensis]URZ87223.1 TIGR03943 family protein [Floricoccus penangensis]